MLNHDVALLLLMEFRVCQSNESYSDVEASYQSGQPFKSI